VVARDAGDHLLDQHGLAHTRAAEQADLAALDVRREQVDDLDAGSEHLGPRLELVQRRGVAVDRPPLLDVQRREGHVERLTQSVEHVALGDVADRYLDGRAGVDHLGAAHHAIGGLHRDGTHDVVADVLLNFQRQRPRRVGVDRDIDVQRVVDLRQLIRRELHVYDGADNPRDAAGAGDGVAALGCLLIGRGHVFLTHSLHSRRPARWRRRRSR
jgi:peptide chain release factor 1